MRQKKKINEMNEILGVCKKFDNLTAFLENMKLIWKN